MINQTTRVFRTKSKRFSIMLPIKGIKRNQRNFLNETLSRIRNESLSFRRWFRRLCTFYKIKTQRVPKYIYKLIPIENSTYDTRCRHSVGTYFRRTNAFKYSFFPYTIREWNKLDLQLRNGKSFKKVR